jgi:hypothetical protein
MKVFTEFNSCYHIDLINFQSHKDDKYKFIIVYKEHPTNFIVLKPLEFKRAKEEADNLIYIFTILYNREYI